MLKKLTTFITTFALLSTNMFAFNFDIELEPNTIITYRPLQNNQSYNYNDEIIIHTYYETEDGEKNMLDIPEGWDIWVQHVDSNKPLASYSVRIDSEEITRIDRGVYRTFAPYTEWPNAVTKPTDEETVALKMLDQDQELVDGYGFNIFYPELEYKITTNSETYNPSETITIDISKKLYAEQNFFPISLDDHDGDARITMWSFDRNEVIASSKTGEITSKVNEEGIYTMETPYVADGNYRLNIYSDSFTPHARQDFTIENTPEQYTLRTNNTAYTVGDSMNIELINIRKNAVELPQGWYIETSTSGQFSATVASTVPVDNQTEIKKTTKGLYSYILSNAGNYTLNLKNNAGETMSSKNITVNQEENNVIVDDDNDDNNQVNNNGGGNAGGNNGGGGGGVVIIRPPEVPSQNCGDTDGHWAENYMDTLLNRGELPYFLNQDDEIVCLPQKQTLRKEFVKWLVTAYQDDLLQRTEAEGNPLGLSLGDDDLIKAIEFMNYDYDNSPYSDILGRDHYDNYIIFASLGLGNNPVINGNPDRTFRPENPINRAEVLKILLEASDLFSNSADEVNNLDNDARPAIKFYDENQTQHWYTNYLHFATQAQINIIEGRQVNVNGTITQQAAMSDGVLNSEAAKILFFAKELAQ